MTRINPFGWFIVAFFLIGGVAFTIAMPSIGIGQIWIGVAVLVGVIYFVINRRVGAMQALKKTGLPGQAHILEATQTGVYVNEQPQMKLRLRVEAQGLAPYEMEKRATVPFIALATLGSGRPLSVYVDPSDHENVYIEWSGALTPTVGGGGVTPGTAPFTFAFPDGTSIDLSSDVVAQKEILDVLRANGLDPHSGTLDLRSNPRVRQAVLDVAARRGYRVPGGAAAAASSADTRPGVDRLVELQQMRDKGLITEADFEETKDRILRSL
jgi:putative oligomerization/nucleic acid binding protein